MCDSRLSSCNTRTEVSERYSRSAELRKKKNELWKLGAFINPCNLLEWCNFFNKLKLNHNRCHNKTNIWFYDRKLMVICEYKKSFDTWHLFKTRESLDTGIHTVKRSILTLVPSAAFGPGRDRFCRSWKYTIFNSRNKL